MHIIATIIFVAILKVAVGSKSYWTYDLLGIENDNQTPDILETHLVKRRVSRGEYAIGGFIHFKQDATDDMLVKIELFYSRSGSGKYIRTPLRVPESPLSNYLNVYYKPYFMDSFAECAENSPVFEDKVDMPFPKRKIILNDCTLNRDDLPSHLNGGYYRFVITYSNECNGSVTFDALVQQEYV